MLLRKIGYWVCLGGAGILLLRLGWFVVGALNLEKGMFEAFLDTLVILAMVWYWGIIAIVLLLIAIALKPRDAAPRDHSPPHS
jgi:hypothetical protein